MQSISPLDAHVRDKHRVRAQVLQHAEPLSAVLYLVEVIDELRREGMPAAALAALEADLEEAWARTEQA